VGTILEGTLILTEWAAKSRLGKDPLDCRLTRESFLSAIPKLKIE
jgi:hypothetical protein